VDRRWVALAALRALADDGMLDTATVASAIGRFGIDPEKPNPVTV
jgi:pyruvate dehydrogenase E1 component